MRATLGLSAAVYFAVSAVAQAQTLEDRLRDQLRQTTEQLRQLQDGQSALQARAAAAETERDSLKKQIVALQAHVARPQVSTNDAALSAANAQITKDKEALSKAASSVHEAQTDHQRLQTTVTNQATMLSACEQKNAQLLTVSNEILDRFQHVDWLDAFQSSEPFVQSAHVRLEQIAQDYGDRIYDGKFDPRTVKKPPAPNDSNALPAGKTQQTSKPNVETNANRSVKSTDAAVDQQNTAAPPAH